MRNADKAILFSVALHAAFALVLGLCCRFSETDADIPLLDVSKVELSLISDSSRPAPSRAVSGENSQSSPAPAVDATDGKTPSSGTSPANEVPPAPSSPDIPKVEEPIVQMHSSQIDSAQVDAPAKPVNSIVPVYPKSSRRRGEEGLVKLTLSIDAMGIVSHAAVTVSSGFKELDAAALKAIRSATFQPARRGDDSVASTVGITLEFKLR